VQQIKDRWVPRKMDCSCEMYLRQETLNYQPEIKREMWRSRKRWTSRNRRAPSPYQNWWQFQSDTPIRSESFHWPYVAHRLCISFRWYKTHINMTNELFLWWIPDFRQRGGTSGAAKLCWHITEGSTECCWLHGFFVGSFYQSSLWIGSMLSSGAVYWFTIDVVFIHYVVSVSRRVSSPTAWPTSVHHRCEGQGTW
jgi:hypothetical protein